MGFSLKKSGGKNLRMPRELFMKLIDFIDFTFYRLLQLKLLSRPPCCFEVTLT